MNEEKLNDDLRQLGYDPEIFGLKGKLLAAELYGKEMDKREAALREENNFLEGRNSLLLDLVKKKREVLRRIACSAPCKDGHESFNTPGQPCDQRLASEALSEAEGVLAKLSARVLGRKEMKLEDQVCSLELAKRLKELGVKQESLFYWHPEDYAARRRDIPPKWFLVDSKCLHPHLRNGEACSAFTVGELGEILPKGFSSGFRDISAGFRCTCRSKTIRAIYGRNEADARAKMLIHLLENKPVPAGTDGVLEGK